MLFVVMEIYTIEDMHRCIEDMQACLHEVAMPVERMLDLRLSLLEVLSNAIIHGNGNDLQKCVRFESRIFADNIQFIVGDEGDGVPEEYLLCDIFSEEKMFSENGRGLYLLGAILDEFWYNRQQRQFHGRINW